MSAEGPAVEGRRELGGPLLFAVAYSAVGFSLYFSLGVVADRGLGLTPLLFLGAGLMFTLATMSFAEGGTMFLDRGGSANFARHAFNELIAFVAAWALLIDFILVIALAAVSTPHYLAPIWDGFSEGEGEVITAVGVVAVVAVLNVMGWWGLRRPRLLVALAIGDLVVQLLVIVVGVAVVFEPSLLTENLHPFDSPSLEDAIYAVVIATVAFAGIEAAADVAPDLEWSGPDLRRAVTVGASLLPILYAGVAAIALMAVPVVVGSNGPETELGGRYIDDPVLGVVNAFEPTWVADAMEVAVTAVAPAVLVWAASTAMLGLSRHVYVLATNRQIPSWLGKLGRGRGTPYVAILSAGQSPRRSSSRVTSRSSPASTRSARRSRSQSPTRPSCGCGGPCRSIRAPTGYRAISASAARRFRCRRWWDSSSPALPGSPSSSITTRRGGSAAGGWSLAWWRT